MMTRIGMAHGSLRKFKDTKDHFTLATVLTGGLDAMFLCIGPLAK